MSHIQEILIFANILFAIGIFGALTRRNMIGILMSIELIFNSSCLNFVAFSRLHNSPLLTGDISVLFVIAVAAAEVAVGLGLLMGIYRNYRNISSDQINLMKG